MALPLIVIPVFNAYRHLKACLESIAKTVPRSAEVLLIDDASTDERIQPLLRCWVNEASAQRRVLLHEKNRGFVATANHGMRLADRDVVLLNSDTEVGKGWLQQLADCLASDRSIATATPWSNNGEIVSVPAFCAPNPVPDDLHAVAEVIASCGQPVYPDIPTAVGFCMAVSREAIKHIGLFDEDAFGLGYGEENDFCQRAEQAGFRNVVCDNAYVAHHGGASFGPLGLEPDANSMQRLLAKHPDYMDKVSKFIQSDPLAGRREEIIACLERAGIGMR
ncbi:MAG: glycosyltransferase family 2 protein [Xanthomonadales bacterium]|nr:glycosyltransferase family 2 protein [Xanthomonadales bacterium]